MSKNPLDHALDLLVFAPLGVALTARDALPELIDKGRGRLTGQVSTARMMGQLAVSQGQREAEKAVAQFTDRLAGLGLIPDRRRGPEGADPVPSADETAVPPDPAAPAPAADAAAPDAAAAAAKQGPAAQPVPPGPAVSAEDLAIPGYDSLSASQVVQRLAGLSTEELDAVRSYETSTRHRKTILTRVSQLQEPSQP